jgi:DNA repair photolyase
MRWNEQQVGEHGVGAAQALPGLDGLLRTVRTPEFAGMVFHEVEARSALNRVPGSSPMPFRWTVNPYRGCAHACVYCLAGPTRVLLADGGTRPIAELRVGDVVLGTEQVDGVRRYVPTRVLAHWSTTKPAYVVRLAGGTELVTSGEHRFLTAHGWRHVSAGWCRAGRRPHLRPGSPLLGPGPFGPEVPAPHAGPRPAEYRRGYLCGLVRGDGPEFPSGRLALEALGRAHHLLAEVRPAPVVVAAEPGRIALVGEGRAVMRTTTRGPAGPVVAAARRPFGPAPAARGSVVQAAARGPIPPVGDLVPDVVRWPEHADADWCAGFLAGVVDACGEVTAGELRVVHTDEAVVGRVAGALHRLGFAFAVGAQADGARVVRLLGGVGALRALLARTGPAVTRRLAGAPVTGGRELAVVAVRALGYELPMYDITTGTGDFVAEGVISHNCFARNTHTYLDMDAGADFDRQIVVKVNVARVLRRELRSPRWSGEPVAMGTNTDPYQRAEGRYRLMPGIIDAFARAGTPFSVLTKGTVLSRDLPALAAAAADVPVSLGVSIALLDRAVHATLEPGTPTPAARLDLVRRITDAGLPCGVMVAPVLPMLTDSAEALDNLLARVAAAGATGASVLALHLRPGSREWFLGWLEREHPELVEPYARLYRRGAYVAPDYRRALAARVAPLLRRHGLDRGSEPPVRAAPAIPTEPSPEAEQLALL